MCVCVSGVMCVCVCVYACVHVFMYSCVRVLHRGVICGFAFIGTVTTWLLVVTLLYVERVCKRDREQERARKKERESVCMCVHTPRIEAVILMIFVFFCFTLGA